MKKSTYIYLLIFIFSILDMKASNIYHQIYGSKEKKIIFFGNSITQSWSDYTDFFSDKGYLNIDKRVLFNNWHPHTYTDVYSHMFDHCKDSIKNVFECGIGTNTLLVSGMGNKYQPGASLKVWRDYFINANIFGADVDRNILFEEHRIETNYVDQTNSSSILDMWKRFENIEFDLMIDDGLHTFDAGKTLFENSFYKLKPNGIYVIEDVSHLYLYKLAKFFKDYNHIIIKLKSSKANLLEDNNMIIIKK